MSFAEGKISLEEYVSSLKTIVGISVLVVAVGIGKGKEDLTGLAMEPAKTNQMFAVCPKIPIGKACSSLTPSDIVKFLTGGFRLSKARCNDIFWEAVWPRLLARGWHSEQPRNLGYLSSKHHLVFLMPGIKKFSRRKLVKGNDYFDSVSDVLSKVASEPKLLELGAEEVRHHNEGDGWVPEVPSDQDDPSEHERPCYLKPRVSNCIPDLLKFTVVDSSVVHDGELSVVRELRCPAANFRFWSKMCGVSRELEGSLFENLLNEYELHATDMPLNCKNINNYSDCNGNIFNADGPNPFKLTVVDTSLTDIGKSSIVTEMGYPPVECKVTSEVTGLSRKNEEDTSEDSLHKHEALNAVILSNCEKDTNLQDISDSGDLNQPALNADCTNKLMEYLQEHKTNASDESRSKRAIKHQFYRRAKSDPSNGLVPLMKRRRLTACAKTEISRATQNFSVGQASKQVGSCCALSSPDAERDAVFQVGPSQDTVLSISSSATCSPDEESIGCIHPANCLGMEVPYGEIEKHQAQVSSDLMLPQVPLNCAKCEPMEVEDSEGLNLNDSCFPSNTNKLDSEALSTSISVSCSEKQANLNPRRQSTRNRPLTTKALEAFESGFLNSKRRQKSVGVHAQDIPFTNPRKARSKVKATPNYHGSDTGIVHSKEEKETNDAFTLNRDFASKSIDQIEGLAH